MTTGVVQVSFTAADRGLAERIVDGLVADGWVACGQVGGPIRSTYRWRGVVERAEEWTVTLKTSAAAAARVVGRVRAEHHDEVPEILVVAVAGGDPDYLDWVLDHSRGPDAGPASSDPLSGG
jgi:periplasmic divalent cation tolerance protein